MKASFPLKLYKMAIADNGGMERATTGKPSRPHGLSLRSNFSWNLVGNVVYAGCQWGILVVLAKLTNPEMVGRFALGLAITTPIIMLSWLHLRSIQATDIRGEYAFAQYLGLRLTTTALALLIVVGVVLLGPYTWETAIVILAVGLAKGFESISDVYYGLMQRYERMDRIAKSRMIKGPLSLLVLGLLVFLTGDVFWGVIGLATTWCLLLFTYDVRNATVTQREFCPAPRGGLFTIEIMRPDFNISNLLRMTWLALPLGIGGALISLQSSIPNLFIESYWGEGKLGIFAALAYISMAGTTIVAAMGQSAIPRLAKYYFNNEIKKYKHLLILLLGIGFFLALGGILFAVFVGRPFLSLFYQPEYSDHNRVFVCVMVAGGMSYIASFLNNAITVTRNFKVYIPLMLTVIATTTVASIWLIPRFALIGAALSLALGSFTQIIVSGIILHAVMKKHLQKVIG